MYVLRTQCGSNPLVSSSRESLQSTHRRCADDSLNPNDDLHESRDAKVAEEGQFYTQIKYFPIEPEFAARIAV
jgi:hypothetical protein